MKRFSIFGFEDFRHVRFFRTINLILQVVLALLFVAELNYLASLPGFQARWDLDASKNHTLSLETDMFLERLAKDSPDDISYDNPYVRVITTFPKAGAGASREEAYRVNMLRRRIVSLVENFRYKTEALGVPGLVKYEETDLLKNTRLIAEMRERNSSAPAGTAIVVMSKTRCRTISAADLLKVSRDSAGNVRDVDAFRGEEALMAAILEVTNENSTVIYSLVGEGEARIDSADRRLGLSSFAEQMRIRNFIIRPLNLSQVDAVPADAAMLLIANPTVAMTSRNEEKIERYLRERNGRVLLLKSPGTKIGLDDLLFDWGIQIMDNFVVETDEARITPDMNILINTFNERPHKISGILVSQKLPLVASQFCEIRKDIGSKEDSTRMVSVLAFSSNGENASRSAPKSWGERDYRSAPYSYNPDRGDIPGPVPVVAVSERVAGTQLGVSIPGGRLIVVGAGDIASNAQLENGGNKPFLLNAVNWLCAREILLNIPPRPISDFRLKASMPDLIRVAWVFGALPLAVAILGLLVAFWRRRL